MTTTASTKQNRSRIRRQPTIFRLTSVEFVNTPGMIDWARSGMTPTRARVFIRTAWPTLSRLAVANLVKGNYKVDSMAPHGGTVVVEG